MKGKIVLIDIDNPVQGMQVVYGNNIYTVKNYIEDSAYVELLYKDAYIELLYKDGCGHSMLKQIVIEYITAEPKAGFINNLNTKIRKKNYIPLAPEQWSLALVGKKVDFEIGDGKYIEPSDSIHSNRGYFEKVAKIIPIITKRESASTPDKDERIKNAVNQVMNPDIKQLAQVSFNVTGHRSGVTDNEERYYKLGFKQGFKACVEMYGIEIKKD